jgi:hypothetical protein
VRIAVTVICEMTDQQVKDYAAEHGLPERGRILYAREVVGHVRSKVLSDLNRTSLGEYADITIKH